MGRKADQTKAVILAAARERFAESGYEGATIRAIAADANIDPSMVMRYFGNKDQLFAAAAEFDLQFPDLSGLDRSELGAALVAHFLARWEDDEALIVLLRSSTTNAEAAQRMKDIFAAQLLPAIAKLDARRRPAAGRPDRHADARHGAVPLRAAATAGRRRCRGPNWSTGSARRCSATSQSRGASCAIRRFDLAGDPALDARARHGGQHDQPVEFARALV